MTQYLRYGVALVLVLVSFMYGWWPAAAFATVLLFLSGSGWSALALALFLDVLYGAPTGVLRFVPLPITFAVIVAVLVRHKMRASVRPRSPMRL